MRRGGARRAAVEREPGRRACWPRPLASAARALVTEAELLALPVTSPPMESLDGEVVRPPRPTLEHQEIVRRVAVEQSRRVEQGGTVATVGVSPLDVRFGPSRVLQPDPLVILDRVAPSRVGPITRIPDSRVEVLSSDRVYYRVTKRLAGADLAGESRGRSRLPVPWSDGGRLAWQRVGSSPTG